MSELAPATPIEIWFQDEMRIGQKNSLVYQWAKKGSRPRQPKDQRYENAYVFGAVCPQRDTGVALIMPLADTEAMQAHLDEIGRAAAPGAHAVLILDKAGWHTTRKLNPPANVSLLMLPARLSRTQCGREHLAVSAPNLSLQPRVRKLHYHSRHLPKRMAQASC